MKIVIWTEYGGFKLTDAMVADIKAKLPPKLAEDVWAGGISYNSPAWDERPCPGCGLEYCHGYDHLRAHPALVSVVERHKAMPKLVDDPEQQRIVDTLCVVEIPDGVDWYIAEYDGSEWIAERHRTWGRP